LNVGAAEYCGDESSSGSRPGAEAEGEGEWERHDADDDAGEQVTTPAGAQFSVVLQAGQQRSQRLEGVSSGGRNRGQGFHGGELAGGVGEGLAESEAGDA